MYNTPKVPAILKYILCLFVVVGVKAMELQPLHLRASLDYALKIHLKFTIELFLLFRRREQETFITSRALGLRRQNTSAFWSAWGDPFLPPFVGGEPGGVAG